MLGLFPNGHNHITAAVFNFPILDFAACDCFDTCEYNAQAGEQLLEKFPVYTPARTGWKSVEYHYTCRLLYECPVIQFNFFFQRVFDMCVAYKDFLYLVS